MRSLATAVIGAIACFYSLRGIHGVLQRTTLDNTTPRLQQHQLLNPSTFYRQNNAGNGRPTQFFAP